LKSKDLNTIISQESLLSNRKQVDALKSNLEANRLGSFESVLSQTVTVSSNTSNTIKEPQQQQREPIQLNSNPHRRSISMETFQADQVAEFTVQQSNHQPNYNKFGTISGYSTTKTNN